MNMYAKRLLFICTLLVIIVVHKPVLGQEAETTVLTQPSFVQAFSPLFLRFIKDESGVAEIVIKVTMNNKGKVVSTQTVSWSVLQGYHLEYAAKQWLFESSPNEEERTAEIKFVLRILPKGRAKSNPTITTRLTHIEVRCDVSAPPDDYPAKTKKPSQTWSKQKLK